MKGDNQGYCSLFFCQGSDIPLSGWSFEEGKVGIFLFEVLSQL